MGHKGWHTRGYLPHMDGSEIVQHVVFRLHDSLPPDATHSGDDILDRGHGCAVLHDPECAAIVANALMFHNGERYALHAWCVMPNHVHALIETDVSHELGAIVQAWKGFTAKQINKLTGQTGNVWAADYFDRFMRDEAHYQATKQYIEMNPVSAGLCERPEDWRYSSAGWPHPLK